MAFAQIPVPNGLTQLPRKQVCGIYFLFYRGVVVYVGQSVHMAERIKQHLEDGAKVFDAVHFMPCAAKDLNRIERHYIETMAPKYNQCRLAKAMRRLCADRLQRRPVPFGRMSAHDAAEFLGISKEAFWALLKQGNGPLSRRTRGRRGRSYFADDLRQWAEHAGHKIPA